jgi:hypothetical protein
MHLKLKTGSRKREKKDPGTAGGNVCMLSTSLKLAAGFVS